MNLKYSPNQLLLQVCLTICHFILMLVKEDLVNATLPMHPVSDVIKGLWQTIIAKVSPEESLDIQSVKTYLEALRKSDLSPEQKMAFNVFEFCFSVDNVE